MSKQTISKGNLVHVVYGIDMASKNGLSNAPWIHSVHADELEAFNTMEELQHSDDYGHMSWSCNRLILKGEFKNDSE